MMGRMRNSGVFWLGLLALAALVLPLVVTSRFAIDIFIRVLLFAFIGVVVTSATTIIYGTTIWDPVVLASRFDNKILISIAMLAVALSTLATNID